MPIDKSMMIMPVDPKQALIGYAADVRWQKEVGGFEFGGMQIATDDRSKMMIAGASAAADRSADFTTQWKTDAGFVVLDASTIIAISNAVLAHVSNCFAIEAEAIEKIDAGELTTKEEISAFFQNTEAA